MLSNSPRFQTSDWEGIGIHAEAVVVVMLVVIVALVIVFDVFSVVGAVMLSPLTKLSA